MPRYESNQSESMRPAPRNWFIDQGSTGLQRRSHILAETEWMASIGQANPEILFNAPSKFGWSKSDSDLSSSLEAQPGHLENTDYHRCAIHTPRRARERKFKWKFSGWRAGVTFNACVTAVVLILNVILIVWASLSFPMDGGFGTLIHGDCNKVATWSLWLHLTINILSTILLAASNYTMQCLLAPTRREVDKAHMEGKQFSIGFGETLNLFRIGWNRKIIYILLVFSSVPLHLLYNSAIFKTSTAREYSVFVVNESFLRDFPSSKNVTSYNWIEQSGDEDAFPTLAQSSLVELQQSFNALQRLSPSQCVTAYATDFLADRGSLLAVTRSPFSSPGASLMSINNHDVYWAQSLVSISTTGSGASQLGYDPLFWMCQTFADYAVNPPCTLPVVQTAASNLVVFDFSIDYCLSQPKNGLCTLEFSLIIMIVTIIANAVKAICMALTVISFGRESPLITIGDAAASFLEQPDTTTKNICLCDATLRFPNADRSAKPFIRIGSFWHHATSSYRRFITFYLCFFAWFLCACVLGVEITSMKSSGGTSMTDLWDLGFGSLNSRSLIIWSNGLNKPILRMVLLTNTPQVFFSALYVLYNTLYSSFLSEDEWQRYSYQRRALRVTAPAGQQRSTYFLSLPYRHSISLMVMSGLLHWLVSQSIFLARLTILDQNDEPILADQVTTCGFSGIAFIFVMLVWGIMLFVALAIGLRRFILRMPIARGSSIIISAACHPHELDKKASILPVQWGVTDEEEPGHCTLTSFFVYEPVPGRLYA